MGIEQKDIEEIIKRTFRCILSVYNDQKEGNITVINDTNNTSRIIFPQKSNKKTRISEQELRFIFVEEFNKYCDNKNINAFYSVETPTIKKYSFTDKNNPKVTENGESANMDLVIFNEKGERFCIIEFKYGNPAKYCYSKDICKLNNEKCEWKYFIEIIDGCNKGTINNIIGKKLEVNENQEIIYKCYSLKKDEEINIEKLIKERK